MRTSRSSVILPLPVRHALRKLGRDIRDARRRRRIPAAIAAQRASISRTTLVKIEKGRSRRRDRDLRHGPFCAGHGGPAGRSRRPEERSRRPAARRRKPAAAHSRGGPETHERQVMDTEALVYVDLDGVPHLTGRLCARTQEQGKRHLRIRQDMAGKSRAILSGASPGVWTGPVSHCARYAHVRRHR
jgi:hypothetical protein